jgi:DNA-binding transcriptional LysR family regulator
MILLSAGERCYFDRSFDTQMAETVKAMILAGHGLGWLPESCVGREATERRLVPAGSAQWTCTLEIRLHRAAENSNPMVDRIWGLLSKAERDGRSKPSTQ